MSVDAQLREAATEALRSVAGMTPPDIGLAARQVRFRWAIALVAAAVVVVLVGGVALLFRGDGRGQPAATEAPPTSSEVTGSSAVEPPVVPAEVEDWRLVGTNVTQSVDGLFDIERAGSGLVAIGFSAGEDQLQDGVVLVSEDGIDWSRLAEDDPALTAGKVILRSVIEGGPGLVAVGASCDDDVCESGMYPTAWTSTDGMEWTRILAGSTEELRPGHLGVVAATSHGYVAGGAITEAVGETTVWRPAIWLSPDAADWSNVWEGEASTDVAAAVSGLAEGPDGLVVAVGSAPNDSGDPAGAVWASDDGQSWERIAPNSPVFVTEASIRSEVYMMNVTWGPTGFVAVGTDGGDRPAIWSSPDGRTWMRVDLTDQPFDGVASLGSVSRLGSGLIAAGPFGFVDDYPGPVTLWTSPDGRSWDRVLTLGTGWTRSVVVLDTTVAVAGHTAEGDGTDGPDTRAAVWVGPAFDVNAPPPDPLPPVTESETLSCEDLATLGYSYAEVAVYWIRHGTPADLDADSDGIPCEFAFAPDEVSDVFGPPQALAITMEYNLTGNTPFRAAGPAVDAGVVCPSGTPESVAGNLPPTRPGAVSRWQDRITCDDGSGFFVIGVDVFEIDDYVYGIWEIYAGFGAYETLEGGGTCLTGPITTTAWGGDHLTGRITDN